MNLKTFETTLGEYQDTVRINLKVQNPTLLKSGALGILTNYLAVMKYDTATYYNKIFSEMNIGLASDFKSMLFHSTIYNTEIELAKPSVFGVSFIIPEINLSDVDYVKYTIPKNKTFRDKNGVPFVIKDEITIELTTKAVKGYSWSQSQGKRELNIIRTQNPKIPGSFIYLINYQNVEQYERNFYKFLVPDYAVGDAFSFSVAIQNFIMLKDVNVWLNESPADNPIKLYDLDRTDSTLISKVFNTEEFNTKYYNYSSSRYDLDIFVDIQQTSLKFTTGDGINGKLLKAGNEIIIESQITLGENGNLQNTEFMVEDVIIQELRKNGSKQAYGGAINGISISGGVGGQNIESVNDIRTKIFDKITTRGSIISANDYEKSFAVNGIIPFVDSKYIDAKTFIFLFNVLKYRDTVIKTTSLNLKEIDIANNPFYPVRVYGGVEIISPFYYKRVNTNETEAYIVNPKINIELISQNGALELTQIENLIDLSLNYDFGKRKSYLRIDSGDRVGYTYRFTSSVFNCNLDYGNNYEYEVNTRYTDTFCIISDILHDIKVDVYDDSGNFVISYFAFSQYHQLTKKQTFFKYYKRNADLVGETVYTTDDTYSYLDNILENILATIGDLTSSTQATGDEPYLLRIPFLENNFFYETDWQIFYSIMDNFFMVDKLQDKISPNTKVGQTFYNTIDIPFKYRDYIFEQNTIGNIPNPKMPIDISVSINEQELIMSKWNSIFDFEIGIKLKVVEYLKNKEGFGIQLYETEIETMLYNEFSPIIKNIKFVSPKMFSVNNPDTIFDLIGKNLLFEDILDFVPPYFHYDYETINLDILS